MIKMILATDSKNGIGYKNTIPWHSKDDFKHFKEETVDSKVIMGYNTWLSLPEKSKPLPNRLNIVVTNREVNDEYHQKYNNVIFIHESHLSTFMNNNDNIIVIGGAKLYERLLRYVDVIIKSTIQGDYDCDTFFNIHGSEHDEFEIDHIKSLDDGTIVEYYKRTLKSMQNKVIWI